MEYILKYTAAKRWKQTKHPSRTQSLGIQSLQFSVSNRSKGRSVGKEGREDLKGGPTRGGQSESVTGDPLESQTLRTVGNYVLLVT